MTESDLERLEATQQQLRVSDRRLGFLQWVVTAMGLLLTLAISGAGIGFARWADVLQEQGPELRQTVRDSLAELRVQLGVRLDDLGENQAEAVRVQAQLRERIAGVEAEVRHLKDELKEGR